MRGPEGLGAAGSGLREGAVEVDPRQGEFRLAGKTRGHGELDPPDALPHQGADLQELQADGAAGGAGKTGGAKRVWRSAMRRSSLSRT